jgi:hypothetical protein
VVSPPPAPVVVAAPTRIGPKTAPVHARRRPRPVPGRVAPFVARDLPPFGMDVDRSFVVLEPARDERTLLLAGLALLAAACTAGSGAALGLTAARGSR